MDSIRLNNTILKSLIECIEKEFLSLKKSNLYLFGSRIDSSKKGGDIDLLLITSLAQTEIARNSMHLLRVKLREAAQDQRVDLTVATKEELENSEFLKSLWEKQQKPVLLKEWK